MYVEKPKKPDNLGPLRKMFEQLAKKKLEYESLEKELATPALLSNRELYKVKAKEYAGLKDIVAEYDKYLKLEVEKKSLEKFIEEEKNDIEYAVLAKKELAGVIEAIKFKVKELEDLLLVDDDFESSHSVIMEIRAGTGGVEAGLFAMDLFKMYSRYFTGKGWKLSVMSLSESEKGGIKEIIFSAEGKDIFRFLRFEMGTHRVQRVPETEASGRIHTSAATVAVLPETQDVEVDIKEQDLKLDFYRSSGAGGQHVNVTDSAVRITHLPTGIVVSCQDERSQYKNKIKAMRVLKARIYEKMREAQQKALSDRRKKQIGSGDRSEKIRTYNFPENRVTDHRINFTLHNLASVMEGKLDDLIEALTLEDRKLKLATS